MSVDVTGMLIAGLRQPAPAARIEMLRILAMLEETRALPALGALHQTERDPHVLRALRWAGSVITAAAQRGYTTDAALRAFFRLDGGPSPEEIEEQRKLAKLKEEMDIDRIRNQQDDLKRQASNTAMMGATAMMLGGAGIAASVMLSTLAGAGGEDSQLPERGGVIPPQRPTQSDIEMWVTRLGDFDARARRNAAIELRGLNNPAALPHLAHRFALETTPEVRQEVQAAGKALYFHWLRWEQVSAKERAEAAAPPPEAAAPNAADILARAKAAREARKKHR